MPELVWLRVLATGVEWEVPQAQADELTRWYPSEYQIVAKLEDATEEPAPDAPLKTKKANHPQSPDPRSEGLGTRTEDRGGVAK